MTSFSPPAAAPVEIKPATATGPAHYTAVLAGVNVIVEAANPARKRLIVMNQGTTAMRLAFGIAATAAVGIVIPGPGSWDSGNGVCPGDSVNCFGAATATYDVWVW